MKPLKIHGRVRGDSTMPLIGVSRVYVLLDEKHSFPA